MLSIEATIHLLSMHQVGLRSGASRLWLLHSTLLMLNPRALRVVVAAGLFLQPPLVLRLMLFHFPQHLWLLWASLLWLLLPHYFILVPTALGRCNDFKLLQQQGGIEEVSEAGEQLPIQTLKGRQTENMA